MKQSNVIKLVPKSPYFNEDLVMVQNLQQVIDSLVLAHGAQVVMANFPSMIQEAQRKARITLKQESIPVKKAGGSK